MYLKFLSKYIVESALPDNVSYLFLFEALASSLFQKTFCNVMGRLRALHMLAKYH